MAGNLSRYRNLINEHLCSIAVQNILKPEIYHDARFKLRADVRFAQRSGAKLGVRTHQMAVFIWI
jgi:hypothetical protein